MAGAPSPLGAASRSFGKGAREAAQLGWATWKSIVGADKYDNYLAHHRAAHPGVEPLSEREFWKEHYRSIERAPNPRCC